MNRILSLVLILVFHTAALGQEILSEKEFLDIVVQYHPVAQQAKLIEQQANQQLRKAKGSIDPVLSSNFDHKNFDKKNYFALWQSQLTIPTWYGVDIEAGYQTAQGQFVNAENYLPEKGLGYVGVSANLLQGLLVDERRTALRQAELFQQYTINQQTILLNEVLRESLLTYWNWAKAYQEKQVVEQVLQLSVQRFEGLRESYEGGYKSAMDTLEAYIQVQNRQNQLNEATINLRKAALILSNFLWRENNQPVVLTDNVIPEELSLAVLNQNTQNALLQNIEQHPSLQYYDWKLADLEIERRMKQEKLKPKLKVKYNLLGEQFDLLYNQQDVGVVVAQNYKLGAAFSMPLWMRTAKSDVELADIKIADTKFDAQLKEQEINNKRTFYLEQLNNLANQIAIQESAVQNYKTLLEGEQEKFRVGESSLFLVNSRESKYLEANMKLIALKTKSQYVKAELMWAVGQFR